MDKQRIAKEIMTRFKLNAYNIREEALNSYEMDLICSQFPEYDRSDLEKLMADVHAGNIKFKRGWNGSKRL